MPAEVRPIEAALTVIVWTTATISFVVMTAKVLNLMFTPETFEPYIKLPI
ncbi:MAG: hypothetical protein AB7D01_02320 [Methanoculleus sp.]